MVDPTAPIAVSTEEAEAAQAVMAAEVELTNQMMESSKTMMTAITPLIKRWFDAALVAAGRSELKRIPILAALEAVPGDRYSVSTVADAVRLKLGRVVTIKKMFDVDMLRAGLVCMASNIQREMKAYVEAIPENATHVAYPEFFATRQAYVVTWFMWGYHGKPMTEEDMKQAIEDGEQKS